MLRAFNVRTIRAFNWAECARLRSVPYETHASRSSYFAKS
jgi:hypothetical protein